MKMRKRKSKIDWNRKKVGFQLFMEVLSKMIAEEMRKYGNKEV